VVNAGQSLAFRDDGVALTVGSVDVIDSSNLRMVDQRVVPQTSPPTLLAAGLAGAMTNNGNMIIETTTVGNLVLAQPIVAGSGNVGLSSAGTITQTASGIVTAGGLALLAANQVALTEANRVGTLAGQVVNAGQTLSFRDDSTALTVGTVDVVDGFGTRIVDQRVVPQTQLPAALTEVVTNNADLSLQTTTSGDLALSGNVSAGSANAALVAAGNLTQTSGVVTAAALLAQGSLAVSLNSSNAVGTLSGSAKAGSFAFTNGQTPLTIATVPAILGQASQTGLSATGDVQVTSGSSLTVSGSPTISAGGNVTLEATGSSLTVSDSPTISAGGNVILGANGNFTQTGTLRVQSTAAGNRPALVIDDTGRDATGVAAVLSQPASSDLIKNAAFDPAVTTNVITLANLNAPDFVTLLLAGQGRLSGPINVLQLGVSGFGASANLTGMVGGISGPGAASVGVVNPRSQNNYLLNNCVIGSPNCILLPPVVPVQPQLVREIDIQAIQPQQEDVDSSVINIFDEERLCYERLGSREPCR
jgi:hypothetical protein